MRILLAGATGTLGKELVPLLIAAGHEVTGLTRSERGVAALAAAGADGLVVDMMDGAGLMAALEGRSADAVIHQATAITGAPLFHRALHATDDLRDRGTANLLRAARLVGAKRFVTQSFFLGYGYRDLGPGLVTEERPFGVRQGGAFDRHLDSMRSNEEQVLGADGIEGISLRYGMFYGPEPATRNLLRMTRRRRLPATRPSGTISPIHIRDAASATVAALERGRAGEAYNVCDDEPLEFAEYIRALARAAGAPPPPVVPGWVLRATPYMHALMVRTRVALSNAKAREELGWAPAYPSAREGLAAL
ncbi:NAD-dependent epimerase/dehydratase family protein [Bailinhaonella thermotolerans]|uniref:NAD(P)-dependent oxidoreductase n=1 Tax=Bailinhaonella thermotolerans TaxID=1070861 RepID=A0A3A4BQ33_9ACTN|nr:NAD(P)-dependent oxidoreductase [Bailinhaonella thermotolerans]RJL33256.1 NAD(P)-dependent oxidoreductase [Bailinhaonella thermotolerans]